MLEPEFARWIVKLDRKEKTEHKLKTGCFLQE
jgi:hypothetical protein